MKNALPQSHPTLAVVIPCFNEGELITNTVKEILHTLNKLIQNNVIAPDSFIYIIDDGSSDDTWIKLQKLKELHLSAIHGLKFSRNFGHQAALFAGLKSVKDKCDVSISIDADLQQDINAIPQFIDQYNNGADIVFGIRKDRDTDTFFKAKTALFFYKFMNLCGVNIVPNHADYRLISKRVLQVLAEFNEPNLFLRAVCNNLGFQTAKVSFDVSPRTIGESKYSLKKMLSLALQGVLSFSIVPLRFIALLGVFIFTISLIMSIYVLVQALLIGNTTPGWASTVLPIYLIGGLQIFCMGIIGEYLGQIYSTSKKRPNFIIEEEI
jgi:glycosyltransferase involved in cell wall biosynthesis